MRAALGRSFALLATLLLAAAPAAAQTGSLSGRIMDAESGETIANAVIRVLTPDGRDVAGDLTDSDGRFTVRAAPGSYVLEVTSLGFASRRIEVQVGAEAGEPVSVALVPEAIQLNPIVVSASRRPQKRLDAPATVGVVEKEEIRERAAPTVIDHIKGEAGVDVAQTGLAQSNVVARGFNNIFSGALLVMSDYRYAQVPSLRVNAYNFIPATNLDLERVEIVLGPGAALYGPNSANGVMHLITSSPIDDPGTIVSMAGGERAVFHGEGRHSQRIGENKGLRVSGQYFRGNDWRYTDPAEAAAREIALMTDPDTKIGLRDFDQERWSAEGRFDVRPWDDGEVVLSAGVNTQVSSIELTGLGAGQAVDWRYTYAQARLRKGNLFAQTFANFSESGETFILPTGMPIIDESYVLAAQLQHATAVGAREFLTYGVDWQRTEPRTEGTITGRNEADDTIQELGGYLHSETSLTDRLELVAAARVDWHNRLEDLVFSPRAGLVFRPQDTHNLRVTYNRAFSTPTTNNLFLDLVAARIPVGAVGYDVRTLGTPESGFTFSRDCPGGFDGGLCMRSPFAPGMELPANAAVAWNTLVQTLAPPSAQPLLPLVMDPGGAIETVLRRFDSTARTFVPDPVGPVDIDRITPTITTTAEIGYKGLIGNRLLIAADVYRSNVEDFVTPLRVETPNVFLDPATTAAFLQDRLTPLVLGGQMTPDELAALVTQLTTALAQVPIGTIVPDQVDAADILLAYRNFGNVDLWGADISTELVLDDAWSLKGSASWVNTDCFDFDGVPGCQGLLDVSLNAPQTKGSLGVRYRDAAHDFTAEVQGRFIEGFPMNTGVFVGRVPGYGLVDANVEVAVPWVAGASVSLTAYNVLDRVHREFVGAPELGRLVLARLTYQLR
ncbi:MAG TPA: TonB-dependent receptor [Gemmatimonadota bacterium]|nr:TonB-dependent receptor [Gemmatimonadota bacterium]